MQAEHNQWLAMLFDKTQIAINSREVAFITPISDLKYNKLGQAIVHYAGREFPAYSYNKLFKLQSGAIKQGRFVVCFKNNQYLFALVVDGLGQVQLSPKNDVRPLPSLLQSNEGLITHIVEFNGLPLLLSCASKFLRHIQQQLPEDIGQSLAS